MNINIDNYEAYFLDYHEGNLSAFVIKELMDFVAKHPELKEEFESFEPVTLKDKEKIKYMGKESLKKQGTSINASNFDEFAIEYVEGTLSVAAQQELLSFIDKNPGYKKELDLYSKTKLTPDVSVFGEKASLKRRKGAIAPYWVAAASVVLIIGAYFILNRTETPNVNTVAKQEQVKDTTPIASHAVNSTHTITAVPQAVATIITKNTSPALKIKYVQHTNIVPIHAGKDSSVIVSSAVAKGTSVILQDTAKIPDDSKNIAVNANAAVPVNAKTTVDTTNATIGIVLASDKSNRQGAALVAASPKNKKRKILILLAKLTCKGLNKITHQHIEFKERYSTDTTTIVAYQLDLGKREFQFPVKK